MTCCVSIPHRPPVALSIAGSDPSGGAGIQADLKTFSALGAYGTCVVTALTAQSTRGVTLVHEIPPDVVREQLLTLIEDVRIDVVKIGMLSSATLAQTVLHVLNEDALRDVPVVLDPVMVATSGSRLLADDAVTAVREMLPRASVITPNLPEAGVLLGEPAATSVLQMSAQAERLRAAGARRVLVKGGHLDGPEAIDVWLDSEADAPVQIAGPRVPTSDTHGTGCSFASAIAALRPGHDDWLGAIREAKDWLTEALRHGGVLDIGSGSGPIHHFHEQSRWRSGT